MLLIAFILLALVLRNEFDSVFVAKWTSILLALVATYGFIAWMFAQIVIIQW